MTSHRDMRHSTEQQVLAVFGESAADLRPRLESGTVAGSFEITVATLIERFGRLTGLSRPMVLTIAGMPQSTRSHNREPGRPVTVDAADRIFQATRLFGRIVAMRGETSAQQWLVNPNPHLDGRAPVDLLVTSTGRERLSRYLDALADSTYA